MSELSESIISRSLWFKYGVGQWACSNIHYYAFESDLLILRTSGTVIEYEIKLSVSDFKAGLKKKQVINPNNKNRRQNKIHPEQTYTYRHDYLISGLGANMFYYVAPDYVINAVDIPEWAGIIKATPNNTANHCSILIQRKAKSLHRDKALDSMREKIMTSCYYKYWRNFSGKQQAVSS